MDKTPFITPHFSLEIKDDILYVTYFSGVSITLDVAKDIVKKRMEYTEGRPYPLIVTGEGLRAMDKHARDYLATDEGTAGVLAGVLLVNSVYTEFFGNFFLRIAKPEIPTNIFTDKGKALEWLQQFKPKS